MAWRSSGSGSRTAPVLVTWGESRMALAATRALGRAGVPVAVLAERDGSPAFASRYCSEAIRAPDADRGDAYLDFLEALVSSRRFSGLFFCDDRSALGVGRERARLSPHVRFLLPEQGTLELTMNKARLLMFARQADIPFPATAEPNGVDDFEASTRSLRYPLIIKGSGGYASRHVRVAGSPDAAREAFLALAARERAEGFTESPHVQEYIAGPAFSALALCVEGRPAAVFLMRKRRTFPPWGGVCVEAESVDDTSLRRAVEHFLSKVPWHGVIEIEFVQDARDGRFVLIEPSPDPNWGLDLAIAAGFNLPHMAWRLMQGEAPSDEDVRYRVGKRFVWLLPEGLRHIAARPLSALPILLSAFDPRAGCDLRQADWRAVVRQARRSVWVLRHQRD